MVLGAHRLLNRPLPRPPDLLRQGPLRAGAFTSRLHDERVAARLGVALGISFSVCFLTGLLSHAIQQPPGWFLWPPRPVNLYRVTQGLHVLTGLASIPLLLAKLWTVYPKLWEWPPVRSIAHAVERIALAVLVGGATLQLFTGLANIAYWYPFRFFFTRTHYWTAWITIGALLIHVGTKVSIARAALATPLDQSLDQPLDQPAEPEQPDEPDPPGLSRRGFLTSVGVASGVVVVATAGQTVPGLTRLDLLGARRPDIGSQGLPVNKSAKGSGVTKLASDPAYRLRVDGPRGFTLSLDELRALPQRTVALPITCVEGWSVGARWSGVPMGELLDRAGAPRDARVRVESLQKGGLYRTSVLDPSHARDRLTLLALRVNGEELDLDHGFPCRLIAPNRPGVLQTKWVARLEVLT